MGTEDVLTLVIRTDCALLDAAEPGERYVELAIAAQDAPKQLDHVPLNLALVIDRSGSMQGEKLSYVRQAACHVVDQLSAEDRVAVVAYDDEIMLVAPGGPATPERKRDIKARIGALRDGGSTDLAGGWLRGAAEVAETLLEQGINRALLLTDGLANVGITDIGELTRHARELSLRRVSTSTFGVGLDFNEHLLSRMAEHGGGHFHYIERPSQIPEVFRRELGELLTVVAREVALEIEAPAGVEVEVLGGMLHEKATGRITLPLGEMFAGQRREVYLKVRPQAGKPGDRLEIRAALHAAGGLTFRGKAVLTYATAADAAAAPRNQDVVNRAAEVDLAKAAEEALVMERAGQYAAAMLHLGGKTASYAPVAPAAAAPMQQLAEEMAHGLTEPTRKQQMARSYNKRHSRE